MWGLQAGKAVLSSSFQNPEGPGQKDGARATRDKPSVIFQLGEGYWFYKSFVTVLTPLPKVPRMLSSKINLILIKLVSG